VSCTGPGKVRENGHGLYADRGFLGDCSALSSVHVAVLSSLLWVSSGHVSYDAHSLW